MQAEQTQGKDVWASSPAASHCYSAWETANSGPEPPGPKGLSPLLKVLGKEMAETGEESLDGGVEGPGRRREPWLRCLLADAPPLQAFTRNAPQLGQEVSLLPLSDAVLRDAEISLGSRAGEWGSGLGHTQAGAALDAA